MNKDAVAGQYHVDKATAASLDDNLTESLTQLVLASEHYSRAVEAARTKDERKALFALLQSCIQEAEEKKKKLLHSSERHRLRKPEGPTRVGESGEILHHGVVEPRETRIISKSEQVLLLKSSMIQDRTFPIWNDANIATHLNSNTRFIDATNLFALAKTDQLVPLTTVIDAPLMTDMHVELHPTLVQHRFNDCSFVASLIVASQWSWRFQSPLVTHTLYPKSDTGEACVNPCGKYMMKVHLNGALRQVVVDDLLPVSDEHGRAQITLASSTLHPRVCWPAIVEKIFLKAMGNQFQGSNAALDLRLLIGWIPEEVPLRADLDTDALWSKLYRAWHAGNVLITIGSGVLSHDEELDTGIVSKHNYAVTNLEDYNHDHLLMIQNPWFVSADDPESPSPLPSRQHHKSCLRIGLHTAMYQFSTILLNWNPQCWPHKATIHFATQDADFGLTEYDMTRCPQFALCNDTTHDTTVHLLLERHTHGLALAPQEEAIYASMAVFAQASRVSVLDRPLHQTDLHGSPALSLSWLVPAQTTHIIAVSYRNSPALLHNTLTCYTHTVMSLTKVPLSSGDWRRDEATRTVLHGEWTSTSSSGPVPCSPRSHNPQYLLTCHSPPPPPDSRGDGQDAALSASADATAAGSGREEYHDIGILLESPGLDVTFAVTHGHTRPLTWTRQHTLRSSTSASTATSALFTPGGCRRDAIWARVPLVSGAPYSLVVGTSKAGQCAPYKLTIMGALLDVRHAPAMGAGQVTTSLTSHWSRGMHAQHFRLATHRSNVATIHVYARPTSAMVRLKVQQQQQQQQQQNNTHDNNETGKGNHAMAAGVGVVGIERMPISARTEYVVTCENTYGEGDFEIMFYSDSVLRLSRC